LEGGREGEVGDAMEEEATAARERQRWPVDRGREAAVTLKGKGRER
jgi:hypothetical protein